MHTINRAYIKVTPTQLFWQELNPFIIDQEFKDFHEPTLYLIEEDFWDDEEIIKKYMSKIIQHELSQISDQAPEVIKISTIEKFKSFFNLEIGNTVVDCLKTPINPSL